jgi:sugar phosphate isomerase/epimerase
MLDQKYRFGISTTVDYSIDIKTQLAAISDAGFDFISIGADLEHSHYLDKNIFGEIIDLAGERSLTIESVHAPFKTKNDIASSDALVRENALESLAEFSSLTVDYGIPIIIVHPHYYFHDSKEACLERAVRSLEKISLFKPPGINISLENLPDRSGSWIISRLMEIFDAGRFGFCYDSSHENISGEPFHLLKKYCLRMTTCHLSDNQGQMDDHLIPGDGNIDWEQLQQYFERYGKLRNILFEVGTGEPLGVPLEGFILKVLERARQIFGWAEVGRN